MKESEGKNRHTLPLSISTKTQRDFQAAATQELQRCKKTRRGRHDLSQHNLARDKLMTLSIADLRLHRRRVQLTCSLLSIDTEKERGGRGISGPRPHFTVREQNGAASRHKQGRFLEPGGRGNSTASHTLPPFSMSVSSFCKSCGSTFRVVVDRWASEGST